MATKAIPVVAEKVAATLTDYPAFVQPSLMTGWGALTLAEAQSLRFYSDEALTTELAREVVSADEIHVKVPSLTTTTTIYADYDGVRADYATSATYGRNAVWSDYELVMHLQDATTDSTGNYSPTNSGAADGSGQIEGAQVFEQANNDRIVIPGLGTTVGSNNFTASTWVNIAAALTAAQRHLTLGAESGGGFDDLVDLYTQTSSQGGVIQVLFRGTNFLILDSAESIVGDGWVKITYTRSGNTGEVWFGDVSKATATGAAVGAANANGDASIGNWTLSSNRGTNGSQDETRIRLSVLSDDWITTEYNNQSDVGTFWGTVTDAGGGSGAAKNPLFFGGGI